MNHQRPNVSETGRYTIKQTAEELQIDRNTLYKYTHVTGEIQCSYRKIGGRLRKFYLGADIINFWEGRAY